VRQIFKIPTTVTTKEDKTAIAPDLPHSFGAVLHCDLKKSQNA
jgi:hypothetical protein